MLPHFGYHALVVMVQALTPADWMAAAGIVTLGGVAACAAVLASWLRGALGASASALLVAAALVPAAVLVLQPVLPLDPSRYDAWLFGYFPPNQWHSPTTLFSKPFALLLLGLGPAVVWPAYGTRAGWPRLLASAALVVMSVLVKPNFIMAFLPALGVLAVLNWRRADWLWLGLGFALPAVAVLEWQYAVTYALNTEGAGVILAPLHVIRLHVSAGLATLGWRLAASLLFPLAAVACFPSVRADRRVQLAWATFLVGAAIGYLLAEGDRAGAGNFLWSGQLAAFVLFAASAVAVLRAAATGRRGRCARRAGSHCAEASSSGTSRAVSSTCIRPGSPDPSSLCAGATHGCSLRTIHGFLADQSTHTGFARHRPAARGARPLRSPGGVRQHSLAGGGGRRRAPAPRDRLEACRWAGGRSVYVAL